MLREIIPCAEERIIDGARVRRDVQYTGYFLSESGGLYSNRPLNGSPVYNPHASLRRLKSPINLGNGYVYVSLCDGVSQFCRRLHRRIALAFFGPPPFPRAHVMHLNDVRDDNRLENLAWESFRRENDLMKILKGRQARGERHGRAKLTRDDADLIWHLHATGNHTQTGLADLFNVHKAQISRIITGKGWVRHVEPKEGVQLEAA